MIDHKFKIITLAINTSGLPILLIEGRMCLKGNLNKHKINSILF